MKRHIFAKLIIEVYSGTRFSFNSVFKNVTLTAHCALFTKA